MVISVSTKVTRTGKSIEELVTNIKLLQKLSVKEVDTLAKQVTSDFRYYINHSRHRPAQSGTKTLANAFTDSGVVVLPDGSVSVGIGNIAELNKDYPYWFFVNYGYAFKSGSHSPPMRLGYFGHGEAPDPGLAGAGTQAFHVQKKGYLLKPGPIRAMNYVEQVKNRLQIRWGKLREKYISALQK